MDSLAKAYKDDKNVTGKYNIFGVPRYVFAKWNGDKVERIEGPQGMSAKELTDKIHDIGRKYKRDLPWEESFAKAQEKAKAGKVIAAYFLDDLSPVNAMFDDTLKSTLKALTFAKYPYKKSAAEVAEFKVKKAPTLLLLDSEGKELGRIEGKKSSKELLAELEKVTKRDK